MAHVSIDNHICVRGLEYRDYRNVNLSVLDWTPDGGGVAISTSLHPDNRSETLTLVLPIGEALWLVARIVEALEVRMLDGEYAANLDDRPEVRFETQSTFGTFRREWHSDQEHSCHCEESVGTPIEQRFIQTPPAEPTSGLRHFLDE